MYSLRCRGSGASGFAVVTGSSGCIIACAWWRSDAPSDDAPPLPAAGSDDAEAEEEVVVAVINAEEEEEEEEEAFLPERCSHHRATVTARPPRMYLLVSGFGKRKKLTATWQT
jgi:hypothetical protein